MGITDSLSFYRSSLGLLLLAWVIVGVVLLVVPLALYIWIALGVVGALVLLIGGERVLLWGRGEL